MSVKEMRRRRMSSFVMNEAWRLKHSSALYELTFSTSLRLAWLVIRGKLISHYSKVVGVTFEARQKLLRKLISYSKTQIVIKLQRQPNNRFDASAIAVVAKVKERGECLIGYINSRLASTLAPAMDAGSQIIVNRFDVTGGGDKLYGCNISYIIA